MRIDNARDSLGVEILNSIFFGCRRSGKVETERKLEFIWTCGTGVIRKLCVRARYNLVAVRKRWKVAFACHPGVRDERVQNFCIRENSLRRLAKNICDKLIKFRSEVRTNALRPLLVTRLRRKSRLHPLLSKLPPQRRSADAAAF